MELKGSCHCGAVKFSFSSHTPHPFNYCYCSICRKTGGGGGYAINIMGDAGSLKVEGEENISVYQSRNNHRDVYDEEGLSSNHRHFCAKCGSALWCFSPNYPEFIYPFASAIDTPLPTPPDRVHLMLAYKADWIDVPEGEHDVHFDHYPEEGIEEWHKARNLYSGN